MPAQAKVINCREIADRIRAEARDGLAELERRGRTVRVAVVFAPQFPAARLYVERQARLFDELGIECVLQELAVGVPEETVLACIGGLNRDPAITGIVLAIPLPAGVDVRRMQETLLPEKDIEGVHPHNLVMVALGKHRSGPSTGQAVLEVLESTGVDFRGLEAVVVGHSEIVGKPVALGLMERLVTVTVCHVATRDLAAHTRRAEILVVAVGKPRLVTADMVREGAIVVDVGINRVTDAAGRKQTVGDVDFEAVAERAGWITPVPGGVGPVTVAVLLRNAVRAASG